MVMVMVMVMVPVQIVGNADYTSVRFLPRTLVVVPIKFFAARVQLRRHWDEIQPARCPTVIDIFSLETSSPSAIIEIQFYRCNSFP